MLSLQPYVSCQTLKGWGSEELLCQAHLGLAWEGSRGGEPGPPNCGEKEGQGTA